MDQPAPAQARASKPARTRRSTARGPDAWERLAPLWNLAFYGLLLLSSIATVLDPRLSVTQRAAAAGLAAVLGGWHHWLIGRHRTWIRRPLPMLIYLSGATALFVALTALHPVYMLATFFLYQQLFSLLPFRWAVVVAGPFSLVVWWRSAAIGGEPLRFGIDTALIFAGSWAAGAAISLFIDRIIDQSIERRRLIEELEAARDELAAAERQAGVIAERQRLAGEIHDTLAQGFTSIVMHLEAAEAVLPPEAELARRHLDQARRAARDGLAEARRLVWALRPASLEHSTLAEALQRLADRWSAETGIPARVTITGETAGFALHPEVEVTLLRAAQEALANVRKHAGARRVTVTLSHLGDLTTLDVNDNGAGFDPEAVPRGVGQRGGFGLLAMRERAERLGGTLVVESAPAEGTTIAVALPALTGALAPAGAIAGGEAP